MKLWLSFILLGTVCASPALAQSETAKQGEELAKSVREGSAATVLQSGAENDVPGYGGTDIDASKYLDDDEALTDAGVNARYSDPNYGVVIDPTRPEFDPSTIDLSAAKTIENTPESFLGSGMGVGGAASACEPLPNSGASGSTYYETCNNGEQILTESQSCTIAMVPHVTNTQHFFYYGTTAALSGILNLADAAYLNGKASAGVCQSTGVTKQACDAALELGSGGDYPSKWLNFCKDRWKGNATQYSCSAELPQADLGLHFNLTTGTVYLKKEGEISVSVSREESGCSALAGNSTCSLASGEDVCTQGAETRTIEGVPVTQSCWAWSRSFQCTVKRPATDCGDLEKKTECHFDHQECLSENPDGSCNLWDRVFACKTPDTSTGAPGGSICGGDLYCINGECTQVEREASTEFKDAMVAVQTMGNVRDHFDPETMTLFSGEKAGCHKPVFGLVNCCAGKTSGLLTTATGAAALVSGPAAIAALATPFLTMFLCSSEEMMLDVKDRMGLCHYVGTYCSDKVLGVCTSKRKSYCCFESKLSRILQEQGRAQIGKTWGKAKEPDCKGFLIEEFQKLDLSKMDFTEVYSEFIDAAKVPDEVQTSIEIQDKIDEYYRVHGAK